MSLIQVLSVVECSYPRMLDDNDYVLGFSWTWKKHKGYQDQVAIWCEEGYNKRDCALVVYI